MLRFLSPLFRRRIPEEQQSSSRDWNKKKAIRCPYSGKSRLFKPGFNCGWSQGGGGAGGRVLLCLSMMLTYRRGRRPKVPNKQPKNDLFITKQCKTGVTAKTNRDEGPAGRPGIMGCWT